MAEDDFELMTSNVFLILLLPPPKCWEVRFYGLEPGLCAGWAGALRLSHTLDSGSDTQLSSGFQMGLSIYSSTVGSGHFMGLAGIGAASGIAVGAFEWNVSSIFLPTYLCLGIAQMTRKRENLMFSLQ